MTTMPFRVTDGEAIAGPGKSGHMAERAPRAAFCPPVSFSTCASGSPNFGSICSALPLSLATSSRFEAATDGLGSSLKICTGMRQQGACSGICLLSSRVSCQGCNRCGIWQTFSSWQNLILSSGRLRLCSRLTSSNRMLCDLHKGSQNQGEAAVGFASRGRVSKASSRVSVRFLHVQSATRKDGGESRSEEEDEKDRFDTPVKEMDLETEVEDRVEEQVKTGQNVNDNTPFWRNWWRARGQSEIDANAKSEEVEAGTKKKVDKVEDQLRFSEAKGEVDDGASSQESQEDGDEADTKEVEPVDPSESASFWRRILFWSKERQDEPGDTEDDLLLRDLQNLTFNWKEFFDPSPENVVALIFTILILLAFFKLFMQLFVVVMTIILAALKYTILATIVLGFLIFLL